MPSIDLSFLQSPPTPKDTTLRLAIEPLAPLAMTTGAPGKHYPTETDPPAGQLIGMIENAMGLHFGWSTDYKIRKAIAEDAAADLDVSGVQTKPHQPLVAPYYAFDLVERPETDTFDDSQWWHKYRDSAQARSGATRHDWRGTGDDPGNYGFGKTVVRREHVVAEGPWRYDVHTTAPAAEALAEALEDPAGPLYLGTSDGWVDARIEDL
jgi:hypothetical protein